MARLVLLPILALAVPGNATFGDGPGKFPYVGRTVYRKRGETGWSQSASGVAIAPHWVITASHAGGSALEIDGKVYEQDAHYYCPDADLLMYHTKEAMPYFVPPAFESFADLKGKGIVIVGAGQVATKGPSGWQTANNRDFAVHAGANVVDEQTEVPVQVNEYDGTPVKTRTSKCLVYDLDDPAGGTGSLGGKAVPCEGGHAGSDSGGAWLSRVDGKLRLVALCGYVGPSPKDASTGNYGFGALGIGIHLAPYKAWIQATMAKKP